MSDARAGRLAGRHALGQMQLLQLLLRWLLPAVPSQRTAVGDMWSQLSTWGPCDDLDGCAWHSPVTAESAKAAAPYIRRVSLFAATGGCFSGHPGCVANRDLLVDPRNASSAVDATPLLVAIGALLDAGLQVRVVTGSTPIALSVNPPVIGRFGFNNALPASMSAYTTYIAEIARQIVARFGLPVVAQHISFGVFTEANNADWLNASATEYMALYDATVCGLRSAIPASNLTVGSHLTVDYGRWDASAFIQHAWNGTCTCGVQSHHYEKPATEMTSAHHGVQLDFLGVSFYEAAAGNPGDLSGFEHIALGLRDRALALGFRAKGDNANRRDSVDGGEYSARILEFGVEEGRILVGPDGLQLGTHALGDDYQVSWDGLMFAKAVRSGLSYIARWSVNSQMAGPYGVQGMSTDTTSQRQRLDNGAANLARLCMRMALDTFLPNCSATMLPLSAAEMSARGAGGVDRSMVDVVASTNCPDGMPTRGCFIRLLVVHHFTTLDGNATPRNITANVCEAPGVQGFGTLPAMGVGTVSTVGGGAAVWWRDWWADATRGNLSAASGDYISGLSSWGDEPPLASTRAKQIWTARVSAYRGMGALQSQILSHSKCTAVVSDASNGPSPAKGCVSCTLEMAPHSVALVEIGLGRS